MKTVKEFLVSESQTFITSYDPYDLDMGLGHPPAADGRYRHGLTVDASSLGFPPNKWPAAFKFKEKLGNGEAFRLTTVRNMEYKIYKQDKGSLKILVWNK